jgi:hypothetical protein
VLKRLYSRPKIFAKRLDRLLQGAFVFRFLANLFAREYNKPFVLEKENDADVQRIVAAVCISIGGKWQRWG